MTGESPEEQLQQWCSGVDASWSNLLEDLQPQLETLAEFVHREISEGRIIVPDAGMVLRVLHRPIDSVKVLIVGQDPYPTPGHAVGLSFSSTEDMSPLPRSLSNILAEVRNDVGETVVKGADLTPWVEQGVMLLNRVLTARAGDAGSHKGKGWEAVTSRIIEELVQRNPQLVSVLWGRDARGLKPQLPQEFIIDSAHPSPLSARRGFFGSAPFSRTNVYLVRAGLSPITW